MTEHESTCMASYIPIPAVTDPPGELMNSLMSYKLNQVNRCYKVSIGVSRTQLVFSTDTQLERTFVGSVESSRSNWLMIASALKSLTCQQMTILDHLYLLQYRLLGRSADFSPHHQERRYAAVTTCRTDRLPSLESCKSKALKLACETSLSK